MQDILIQSNQDLLREIKKLNALLSAFQAPQELKPYHEWLVEQIRAFEEGILKNLAYLQLRQPEIQELILSQTQQLTRRFQLINAQLIGPLLRATPSDRLCLKILRWLHAQHPQTQSIPLGLADGEFGVWPALQFPIIYFIPASAQRGLLYLSLFFHEFGHLLYACHKPEMDVLVQELQKKLADFLKASSPGDDSSAQQHLPSPTLVIETWYEWLQELFCDAVGLQIGGPCFLKTFSIYLRMTGRRAFQLPAELLAGSSHPVTWLRVKILREQARALNLSSEAEKLAYEWQALAQSMMIQEDYFGFYEERFLPAIRQTIADMLTEASPYQFSEADLSAQEYNPAVSTPVHLLNLAWVKFVENSSQYPRWEEEHLQQFLQC